LAIAPVEKMVEAVIWDFGGVLTSSPFEAFARFEAERGLPSNIIRRTNANNHWENAWAKFERAEVDVDAFDELFAAESLKLGAAVRGKDVLPLSSEICGPRWSRRCAARPQGTRPAASPTTFQPTLLEVWGVGRFTSRK
jgi:FMN phosphatase YigB (HAD superfamily)